MTPVAARRRQDAGRTDSRGRVGFACGFSLPGDGRHKWRPYVWRFTNNDVVKGQKTSRAICPATLKGEEVSA